MASTTTEQDRATTLAQAATEYLNTDKVSASNARAWEALMVPGNPVYDALGKLPMAQVKRYANKTDRIPRDFRASLKPTYSELGPQHTWLKGICAYFCAFEAERKRAEAKAKRASR